MLTNSNDAIGNVSDRFYGFNDGLIRSVRIQYLGDGTRNVELSIACRDAEASLNDGWVTVTILVEKVVEFSMREQPNSTLQVLSGGLNFLAIDDGVGIEFGGAVDCLKTRADLRKSEAFVFGKQFDLEVGPY